MAGPEDIDARYRPLGGVEAWSEAAVDAGAWDQDLLRRRDLAQQEPALADMVARGCLLAAAYQSGALAGVHGGDRDLTLALVSGAAALAEVAAVEPGPDAPEHVRANYEALALALPGPASAGPPFPSSSWVRRAHAVACRPQQVHLVLTEAGWQDHVLAHGDYKHHPNHLRTGDGGWRALVPVADLGREMGQLDETLRSDAFNRLHPVAQAAYTLHALDHIGPFAVGNGRTARALASAFLLRAGGLPLLASADDAEAYADVLGHAGETTGPGAVVRFVEQRVADLAGLVRTASGTTAMAAEQAAALDQWRHRVQAAHQLHALLPAAVESALGRHRRRQDLRWRSDLAGAAVLATAACGGDARFEAPPVTVRVGVGDGPAIEEVLAIDAHPLSAEDRGVVLRAEQAALDLEAPQDDLGPWLDRVMMSLAVRVAAELE